MSRSTQRLPYASGHLLRRYTEKLPILPQRLNLSASLLLLVASLLLTGFLAWWSIKRWGENTLLTATESPLQQSARLSNLWFSPTGDLLGYRQEGWKLTLLRWTSEKGAAPSYLDLDLRALTPTAKKSQATSRLTTSLGSALSSLEPPIEQAPLRSPLSSVAPNVSRLPAETAQEAPAIAVSQDLVGVVWAVQGKLYWTIITSLDPRHMAMNQALSFDLPEGLRPIELSFVGASGLILQDQTYQRLVLYDLDKRGLIREIKLVSRCAVNVAGKRALVVCPGSGDVTVFDFSSPAVSQTEFQVSPQQKILPYASPALSQDGAPAVASDRGTVFVWSSDASGTRVCKELPSPGVAQSLAYDTNTVLVGGGFRGIFVLQPDKLDKPYSQIVQGVTGTSLLTAKEMHQTGGILESGYLAFATSEGANLAKVAQVKSMNAWGGWIVALWAGSWTLILIVIPGAAFWIEETRWTRDLLVRGEIERSFEPVPIEGSEASSVLSLPDPPKELVKSCVAGDCVAFIGAGMGAQAGLPIWRALVQALLHEVNSRQLLDASQSRSLQEALSDGQIDLVADGLVSGLRGQEEVLYAFLSRTFLRPGLRPSRAHNLLRSLNLSAVLTTNFDNLLETTFGERIGAVYTPEDAENLLGAVTKRQFFLLKLYGSLDRTDTVLLAPFQYYEAMARNLHFSRFMESLFSSRTMFFIGAGFEGIESYLAGIKFPTTMPQKHFAVVAVQGGAWRAKADLMARRFGIQVLAFTPQGGYSEVERFLQELSDAVRATGAKDSSAARPVSRLKSVRLENIGPFENLELDLDRNWAVLLGDNGVGKSTILRAIAVGIAGPDSADYAGRLVRVGKPSARIILTTDQGKQYVTEILKGDRTIVQSQPSRPLEPERWLALGFPTLRSFTFAPTRELPPKGLDRLTSEDLMPLIRGDLDPRLDKLKSWIFDLDYRDKTQRVSERNLLSYFRPGEGSTRFTRLLDQFFEVIRRLTPGLRLGEVEIDSDRREVRIQTDDGRLRIELVSQGTQSLLGWVGILLQRLNDFYGEEPDSRQSVGSDTSIPLMEQTALVLIDEIDAHMHPMWQQTIVPALSTLFPNVQFLATTHSPLIVGGMESQQVIRFVRNASGIVEHVSLSERTTMGRVDQLLTSRLFGLDTTLDKKTEEEVVKRYQELAGLPSRTNEQEKELKRLHEQLDVRIPETGNSLESRAKELISAVLLQQFGDKFPEARNKALSAAEEIFAELRVPRNKAK